ncbi:MAG: hypothetical protein QGI83_18345 [Candidatus Latescibacteria bacterium]|jgi:hypothetical protein|nr:hypothetical protein [Candidatus Latescibacterota bacterium]
MRTRVFVAVVLLVPVVLAGAGPAWADTVFSFNGIGDPVSRMDVRARSMGGAGRALIDGEVFDQGNFSSANPALPGGFIRPALSSLFFFQRRTLNDGTRSHAVSDGDMGALRLIVPIRPGASVAVGLEPLTDLDFGLVQDSGLDSLSHTLTVDATGGIQALTLGYAQMVGSRLYLGGRLDLIVLGTISEVWTKEFDNPEIQFRSDDLVLRTHRGFAPALGAVYVPAEKWRVGLDLQIGSTVRQTRHERNLFAQGRLEEGLQSEADVKLPYSLGIGLGYTTGYKWLAALDVEREFWARTQVGRHNTLEVAAGVLYRTGEPDLLVRSKRIEWSAGLHYRSLYFSTAAGSQVSETGASLGFGVPLLGRLGKFRYVLEFGGRGDRARHGVSERYLRQTLAVSAWFH